MSANHEPQGCLTALLRVVGIRLGPAHGGGSLPYALRDDFLSAAELSFLRVLQQAIGTEAIVCPKVNLADVFFGKRPNENITYRNKIDRKHVDFLLCDPATMRPLCAIELDDKSHVCADRAKRDGFVDEVFETARLPLIRVPAALTYRPTELSSLVESHVHGQQTESFPSYSATCPPQCSKCQEPMWLRKAGEELTVGKSFGAVPTIRSADSEQRSNPIRCEGYHSL